jgi:hypothetical protein
MDTIAIFKHTVCGATFRAAVAGDGHGNYVLPGHEPKVGADWYPWPITHCTCGRLIYGRPINGKIKASVKCDGRCTGATGPDCECSCGGANHGADHDR